MKAMGNVESITSGVSTPNGDIALVFNYRWEKWIKYPSPAALLIVLDILFDRDTATLDRFQFRHIKL